MGVIAVAERVVEAPLAVAFARFIDFSGWDRWMPEQFQPLGGPARALRSGDRVRVGVGPRGRVPVEIEIVRLRPNKEVCWYAGLPGVLQGDHSFLFAEQGSQTRIRSEEPLRGALTLGPVGRRIERALAQSAQQILDSFAAHLEGSGRSAAVSCKSHESADD